MNRTLAPLSRTLAYRNDAVVHKFCERYALSFAAADDVFLETKRWLWLVARTQRGPELATPLTLIGYPQLTVVDEMWHTFILFTEAYSAFCHEYFGRFIHHAPATYVDRKQSQAEFRADPEAFRQSRLEEYRIQARYVGEQLGPATVRKWFRTYGRKYPPNELRTLMLARAAKDSSTATGSTRRG
jgi:hypothetical protein